MATIEEGVPVGGRQIGPRSAAKAVWLRTPVMMVLAALALRFAVLPFLVSEQLSPDKNHWRFGYETGRVAYSIAEGKGFSSPLYTPTGPTAWLTPVYPSLVAGVFKLFGSYSVGSAWILLGMNALTSALTCIPIFLIAQASFGEATARWAGWGWVFFPYAIYFPLERIWETWLSTLLLGLGFWLALRLAQGANWFAWAGFGALWGIAALNSPVVLAVLPGLLAWVAYSLHHGRRPYKLRAALAMCVLLFAVTPWFVRNYNVFHRFIPLRDTLGLELYVGNNGDSSHWHPSAFGPWHNEAEWSEFQQAGEVGYMQHKERQAIQFIEGHPGTFVWMSLRRVIYLWTGFWSFSRRYLAQEPMDLANIPISTFLTGLAALGWWRGRRQNPLEAVAYAVPLLFFPLVYYFTHPEVYYMRPLDPFIVILGAYAISSRGRSNGAAKVENTAVRPGL